MPVIEEEKELVKADPWAALRELVKKTRERQALEKAE